MGEVLYRKWRPQTFAEVVGQEPVTRTLRNSVAAGKLAHAYLLCGPRGTGKTSLGRLVAKAANCTSPSDGEPCNACDSCRAFLEGRAIDFVELDAASHNSVDDIRQLRENVVLTPMTSSRKVYLLDEVHMLSKGAENALLKTLEEPPPHIVFVLATTEPHKVESTIISRCQRFDLRRIPLAATVELLGNICEKEGYSLDEASLEEIGRAATGSLRDAINGLEQIVSSYGASPTLEQVQEALGVAVDARSGELARLTLAGDLAGGLRLIAAVRDDGAEMRHFCRQVVRYLRGLMLAKAGALEALELTQDAVQEIKAIAGPLESPAIVRALRAFGGADTALKDDPQSSLPVELALLDLAGDERQEAQIAAPVRAAAPEPVVLPQAEEAAEGADGTKPVVAVAEEDTRSIPAVEQPASSADGGLLEQVRRASKETDKSLSALLNGSCEVKSAEGDTVVLGFYHTFHLERVESGGFSGRLGELFGAALGRAVKVVYEHTPRERNTSPRRGGHLVEAARALGAREVGQAATEGENDGE